MNGAEMLDAFASQVRSRRGITNLPDTELARELGISVTMLRGYRDKELTPIKRRRLSKSMAAHPSDASPLML